MISDIPNHFRTILTLIRLRPFDTATPQGRSNERHRLILLSSLTSASSKLIAAGTTLISVPLTVHYLGIERYGMWMTMSSFLVMLSFADFGIGNGLINAVSSAHGRDDRQEMRRYVSSGYLALAIVAVAISLLFAAAYHYVPWFEIFNVKSDLARREAGPALAVVIAYVAFAPLAGIVYRVQMGMQRWFLVNLWQVLANIASLAGIITAIYFEAGLPWLVLAFVGAPLGTAVLNSVIFFGGSHRDIAPSFKTISRNALARVVHTGSLFLGLQIVESVFVSSNSIIIARVLGAEAVAQYSVPQRMFDFINLVIAMLLAPLWPAYGEARERGDHAWVKRTLLRSLFTGVSFAALVASILFFAGPLIIRLWVGNAITPSVSLLLGLACWKVIETGGIATTMVQNSHDMLRFQLATTTLVAISVVPLRIVLLNAMGISGVVWATIVSYTIFFALPTFIYFRKWWKL
jgi:O-antigen/teichoic acid export membrane protein